MIPSAPQTIRNDFEQELKKVADENKLQSVKRYYEAFQNPDLSLEDLASYTNIDERINHTKYFYFPTESHFFTMNCFERSCSVYFAFMELYPESNPALVYLIESDGSIHATVLFTHQDRLYAADPTRKIFDEIMLQPGKLIIKESEEKEEKSYDFAEITQVPNNTLDKMAIKLRTQLGVVDFMYSSGQIAAKGGAGVISPDDYLFMYVDEEQNIVSEVRSGQDSIRFIYNPLEKTDQIELIRFKKTVWRGQGEEEKQPLLTKNPYGANCSLDKVTSDDYSLKDFAYFIQYVMTNLQSQEEMEQFAASPQVQKRFGEIIDIAKNLSATTYFNFLNYLRFHFGSPENMIPLVKSEKIELPKKEGGNVSLDVPTFYPVFENMYLRMALNMVQFTLDAKRYTQEVSRQIVGK